MSVTKLDDVRANVRLTLEWDPNTGQFRYDAQDCNLMEQLGVMLFACMTVYAQQTKQAPPIISGVHIMPGNLARG